MTFLSPIPALIAAAITVPSLLVLYFLKLRRRPVRVSSTLLWVQATRDLQVNIPFRWLRPTWILVLQLELFLSALARPALHAAGTAAARTILLIDRSASMSARDAANGLTRLDQAKERAARFISELSRGSGSAAISVVSFAAEPAILSNFSPDRGAAAEAVASITPSDQPGDLGAAMRLASAMMAGDTDESGARRSGLVVLYSDGSFAGDQAFTLSGAEFRFERTGPAADGPGDPGPDNLGIVALAARRDREEPGSIRLFVRVENATRRETGAPLVLSLDGKEIDHLPAGEGAQARVVPIYETIEGWKEPTANARSWADLPAQAIKYVRRVEELVGCPIALLSTSPEREDTILVQNPFEA